MHAVQTERIGLISLAADLDQVTIVHALFFRKEGIVLVPRVGLRHRLRVYTVNGKQQRCLVRQIVLLAEVRMHVAIPEVLVATGAASPLPLCFCRKRDLETSLFAQFPAEFHSIVVADTDNRLFRFIGRISLNHVVFPLLIDETAVVIREDNVELFVCRFQLGHPEGFVDLHLGSRISIRFATVATHHEFTGRDTDEIDFHTRSDLNHLTGFLLLSQHFLDPVSTERPTFHLQGLFLYRSGLFRHYRGDRALFLQVVGIVGDFFLPVDTGSVRILVGQFLTTLDLVESLIRKISQYVRIEITLVGSVVVDPVIKRLPFLIGQFHVVMAFLQQAYQFARVGMIFVRLQNDHVAFASLTMHIRMQVQIRRAIT